MTDEKSNTSRRKLLKSIAAGTGAVVAGKNLPENWSRPVVDSVMLPAHAVTSLTFSGSTPVILGMTEHDSLFAQALDSFVPEAGATTTKFKASWCIIPVNDTQADVTFLVQDDEGAKPNQADLYTGRVTVGDVNAELTWSQGCLLVGNADDLLDKMGLIKDAKAGPCRAYITLTGLNVGDSFMFESVCNINNITVNDTLQSGSTCPTAVLCNDF